MTLETGNPPGVLADVRRALGRTESAAPEPLELFKEAPDHSDANSILERFTHEVQAVRGAVHVTPPTHLAQTVLEILSPVSGELAISGSRFLTEIGLSRELGAAGYSVFNAAGDHQELVHRLEGAAAGITTVEYALAETGTLAVSSDEPQALLVSLLPPIHLAIVQRAQIFATLDSVIDRLGQQLLERDAAGRSVSFITGPSRTSDVELVLSIGVHGPKDLHVIVVGD